jgi:cell division septum initiation protein DivIVA
MMNFEDAPDESVTPTLVGQAPVDDVDSQATEPITAQESPMIAAARVLELAAVTADGLVADARAEAESLVTTARARADALGEASRTEAQEVAAELARNKQEQTAELERERAGAMAGLADEKAALEAQIATLRQLQRDHHSQMRQHLTEQLSVLDATVPETPAAFPR